MSEATETTEISDGVYLCSLIRSHDDDDDIQLESELRETSKKKVKKDLITKYILTNHQKILLHFNMNILYMNQM